MASGMDGFPYRIPSSTRLPGPIASRTFTSSSRESVSRGEPSGPQTLA